MRKTTYLYLFIISLFVVLFFTNCTTSAQDTENVTYAEIEKNFRNIPEEVQTSVYWYWISDNISKEGVIKDLEAMKKVGINRAFIGNIGLGPNDLSYGKVKLFSDEWWDIMHAALKKATELNIEIGIFNGPGWSQSGGPWVKPGQSMRYLAVSELSVTGPVALSVKLEKTDEDFQDVKVLAFPYDKSLEPLNSTAAKIKSMPQIKDISCIADGNTATGVNLESFGTVTIDFENPESYVVRSISVLPTRHPINADVELLVKDSNGQYNLIRKFNVNRTNASVQVGFNPYGPVVMAVPETEGKDFRVIFTNANQNCGIAELSLSARTLEERYVEKTLGKMFQSPLPYWHEYMWDEQPGSGNKLSLINPAEILDITQYMDKDGNLKWNVPAGEWKIIRSGMVPTGTRNSPASPEGEGLEIDKMSKKHVAAHFDAFMGEIIRRIPSEDRKTWKVVVQDSYEVGGQNWTDDFIEDFKARYNYDPVPFIPAFNGYVVGSRDITDRFLWDLRRFVADKVAYDFVGGFREAGRKHGLKTWLENYGHWGFPGEFLQYGGQSDEIGGEFWSEGTLGDIENRAASSCGHIYGKKKISVESFTAGGGHFARYPELMKQRGDRFFTEGINNSLLHVYIHQPYEDKNPGMNAWFGNEFNRKNTWFYDMDVFLHYLKRCNYMLQQGIYVADAAYFIGEDAPKMTGVCDPALPKGYSFDYINAEVLMTRAKVKDGYIVLPDGMKYKVLVLPRQETMRPELLKKISRLVNDGAVVLGPAPKRSPSYENYPEADNEVKQLAASLWKNVDGVNTKYAKAGKGIIASGMEMQELFDMLKIIPDFKTGQDDPVLFIHRTQKDGDMYFISNQSGQTVTLSPEFRIDGKIPELWNPLTATVRKLKAYTIQDGKTILPLKLEAMESAFVIFRKTSNGSLQGGVNINYPEPEPVQSVTSPWTVTFDAKMRGPVNPVVMNTLQDWTQSANDSIKYYSGTVIYKNNVTLTNISKDKSYYLDLGKTMVMAKVSVNGRYAGGVWTAPWRVEISDYIHEGENSIEVSVVNNWVNRLIGDSMLPEDRRQTWCPVNPYNKDSGLQSSGLLGPVSVYTIKY
ncbi:glycosyl hydrolase [Dysgonomonas reticulitermitis]